MLATQNQTLVGLRVELGAKGFAPGADVDRLMDGLELRRGVGDDPPEGLSPPLLEDEALPDIRPAGSDVGASEVKPDRQ